ncbi:GLR1_2 [Sanghuangporus weigelae]
MSPGAEPKRYEFDFVVIWGSSGGVPCRAGSYGKNVALIEQSGHLGGACVNAGCVPKKLMWHAAGISEKLCEAPSYCFRVTNGREATFDWAEFSAKRDAYIRRLNGIYEKNLKSDGVEEHIRQASLVYPTCVRAVRPDRTTYEHRTKYICIATGAHAFIPSDDDVPGASLGSNSNGSFELEKQPKRVMIVGGGYIGVEISGMFNALGKTLTRCMEHSGVKVHKSTKVKRVEVDVLLWAIRRRPNIETLNLDAVGIQTNEFGNIVINEWQQITVPNIFTIPIHPTSAEELITFR